MKKYSALNLRRKWLCINFCRKTFSYSKKGCKSQIINLGRLVTTGVAITDNLVKSKLRNIALWVHFLRQNFQKIKYRYHAVFAKSPKVSSFPTKIKFSKKNYRIFLLPTSSTTDLNFFSSSASRP